MNLKDNLQATFGLYKIGPPVSQIELMIFNLTYSFENSGDYRVILNNFRIKEDNDTCFATKFIDIPIAKLLPANTITPNGDGKNDFFKVKVLNTLATYEIRIYNRWGREVFESKDYKDNWSGEDGISGTYYYQITLTPGGETYTGFIEVVK